MFKPSPRLLVNSDCRLEAFYSIALSICKATPRQCPLLSVSNALTANLLQAIRTTRIELINTARNRRKSSNLASLALALALLLPSSSTTTSSRTRTTTRC